MNINKVIALSFIGINFLFGLGVAINYLLFDEPENEMVIKEDLSFYGSLYKKTDVGGVKCIISFDSGSTGVSCDWKNKEVFNPSYKTVIKFNNVFYKRVLIKGKDCVVSGSQYHSGSGFECDW